MRKWWRRFKNKHGWDFTKTQLPKRFFLRPEKGNHKYAGCGSSCFKLREVYMVSDPNGCYTYTCDYCGLKLTFPWKETPLAYHNMQRHIKAKHIDAL